MTNLWFCQTPNPPCAPVFYTITKIHKPTLVGIPIISGCDGLTERLSAFEDKLVQLIAKEQESYLKDSTDFINVTEKHESTRERYSCFNGHHKPIHTYATRGGIEAVYKAYESYYEGEPPSQHNTLTECLNFNSFQFTGKTYYLKLLFHNLKQIPSKRGILKLSFQQLSQKLLWGEETCPTTET